jgi:hypothetical protein
MLSERETGVGVGGAAGVSVETGETVGISVGFGVQAGNVNDRMISEMNKK